VPTRRAGWSSAGRCAEVLVVRRATEPRTHPIQRTTRRHHRTAPASRPRRFKPRSQPSAGISSTQCTPLLKLAAAVRPRSPQPLVLPVPDLTFLLRQCHSPRNTPWPPRCAPRRHDQLTIIDVSRSGTMWPLTRRFTRILCTRPHGRKIEGGAAGQRRRWKGRDGEWEDVRGRARQQGRTGGGGVRSCCSANISGDSSPPGAPPQRSAGQRQRAARRPQRATAPPGRVGGCCRRRNRVEGNRCIAVFPILADVVEVTIGSGSTAHWSIFFIRLNGWLKHRQFRSVDHPS